MTSGVRAGRLLELLIRLQLRGGSSAPALARALEVSVRTVYRDVAALSAAGVPVYAEPGRHGGIRIDPGYRVAGLPRLDAAQARGVLLAALPSVADQLGFDADAADRTLLPAMEAGTERSVRLVRDRLLIEPTHWFVPPEETPDLGVVATAVWEARELELVYRGAAVVTQPLGLVLKGDRWYLLGRTRLAGRWELRVFRLSRVERARARDLRFERPAGFDLIAAWAERQAAFRASLPQYEVRVSVAPEGEAALALLEEGAPDLPLPDDVERDERGWALLTLRFERSMPETARQLLRLGAEIVVLAPADLRRRMASTAAALVDRYAEK